MDFVACGHVVFVFLVTAMKGIDIEPTLLSVHQALALNTCWLWILHERHLPATLFLYLVAEQCHYVAEQCHYVAEQCHCS